MPSGPRLLARFDDFSGGEYGTVAARRAAPNQWTGRNAMVYPDAGIGPRGGVKNLGWTGAAPAAGVRPECAAYVRGPVDKIVFATSTDQAYIVAVADGTGILANQPVNAVGSVGAGVGRDIAVLDNRYVYITSRMSSTVYVDTVSNAVGALAGAPGGAAVAIWGDYLVVANVLPNTNRIRFSAPNNFGSWPATNFLDVGAASGIEQITALRVVRDNLIVFTDRGKIVILSGTLGVNVTVREFLPGEEVSGPGRTTGVDQDHHGLVWWTREGAELRAVPIAFTGAERTEYPAHDGWLRSSNPTYARGVAWVDVVTLREATTVLFQASETATGPAEARRWLLFRNGVWSRHELNQVVDSSRRLFPVAGGGGEVFLLRQGAGEPMALFAWHVESEHPPILGAHTGIGDLTDTAPPCEFTTAEITARDAGELTVAWVDVAYTVFDTNAVQSNHFDVTVNVHDVYESASSVPATAAWDEPPTVTARRRRRFQFACAPGRAFSLTFANLRGVKIDDVAVFGVSQEPRL